MRGRIPLPLHIGRCTRWVLGAFPLLASVALLHPAPAEAQTNIWSATLTVDYDPFGSGCNSTNLTSCSTALSDDNFNYGGTTYDIVWLEDTTNASLNFDLDKAIPEVIRSDGTLTVGSTELSFSDASFTKGNKRASWGVRQSGMPNFSWTNGQQVAISLKLGDPSPPRTTSFPALSQLRYTGSARTIPPGGAKSAWRPSYGYSNGTTLTGTFSPGRITCLQGSPEVGWYKSDAPTTRLGTATSASGTYTLSYIPPAPVNPAKYRALAYCKRGSTYSTAVNLMRGGEVTIALLRADSITQATARLNMGNHSAAWWYKRTAPTAGTCTSVAASTTTADLTNLAAGTNYTYKAYSKTGCNNADVIAIAMFRTLSTVWSSTLTVDQAVARRGQDPVFGCDDDDPGEDNCSTALSDNDFTHAGTTYRVERIFLQSTTNGCTPSRCPFLEVVFSTGLPSALRTRGTLTVGGSTVLNFSSASYILNNKSAIWTNPGITWADNQSVTLALAVGAGGGSGRSGPPAAATASVSLAAAPNPVQEGLPVTLTATLSRALGEDVTIPLAARPGTAEDTDYGAPLSITIAAGNTTGTGEMTTAMDADGDDETVTVSLDAANLPDGVTAGDPSSETVTVSDVITAPTGTVVLLPNPPAAVRADPGDGKAVLSWSAVANAEGYEVRQGAAGTWTAVGSTRVHTVTGLTNGTAYTFYVRGTQFDGLVQGNASAGTTVTPDLPSAPEAVAEVRVTHKGNSLSVSWDAPARATHYDVTYSGGGVNARAAWNRAGTSLEITCDIREGHSNCVSGSTTYTVGVRARNAAGESAWVNSAPAPGPQTAPAAVASVTVVHNGGKLAVAWDAPARATHYDVTYTNTSSGQNARAAWNRAGTSLEITCDVRPDHLGQNCVNAAGTYTVGVRARNAVGESAWTNSEPVAGPALTVADATVSEPSEGTTANLAFVVTLAPASSETVTVAYATSDGTATAGSDYTATSGTLSFAAGETAKTISVPVLADAQDDGGETLTLTLSTPSGARITDGTATGTITNDGPIPQAWIGRFGRTVAHQVLDAVEGRMQAGAAPGRHLTIAGARFEGLGEEDVTGLSASTLQTAHLLTSTSFALSPLPPASRDLSWSVWGQGAVTSFDGREDELTLDGTVTTALLGADWRWDRSPTPEGEASEDGRWRAGLLLSHSRGDGNYNRAEDGTAPGNSGKVKSHLTSFFPWVRRTLTDRLTAWGVTGYGQGELTVTPKRADAQADGADLNADLNLWLAAVGLRGTLLDGGSDGLTLTGTTDALAVGTSSEGVTGMAAAQATVTRLRLGLEAQRPFLLGNPEGDARATLTPSVELGLRLDGGDAETGFGLDLGGVIALSAPEQGLAAEVRGRALLSHAADGFRDQGFSGSLSWRQQPDSHLGAMLSLSQTMGGLSSGGADALLSRVNLEGLAANNDDQDHLKNQRLELQLSYGLPAFGDRLTLTPEVGLGLYDSGRDYRIGWSLAWPEDGESFAFSFDVTRRENINDGNAPEHGVQLELNTQF